MHVPRPEPEHLQLFRGVVPSAPDVVVKPMFGNLAAFVNGNMFAALLGPAIGVRVVDPETRRELDAVEGVGPFGPEGRPMKEYAALPESWLSDPGRLTEWLRRAYEEVSSLPPKEPKAPAKRRAAT